MATPTGAACSAGAPCWVRWAAAARGGEAPAGTQVRLRGLRSPEAMVGHGPGGSAGRPEASLRPVAIPGAGPGVLPPG